MKLFKSTLVTVGLLMAVPAFGQQRPASPQQPVRGYLIAGGGASINTAQTAMTINAEIAENVTRNVQVYMAAGYYDNIMSQAATDQLVQTGQVLSAITGTPWVFEGRDRGRTFSAGAKVLAPTGSLVRPYVGGGFGVLNVRRTIRERSRGNITGAYLAQFGSADGVVDPTQTNTNHPMGEVAAGVGAAIRRAYVDVGYRYRRAFHNVNQSFDVSQVGVAVGLKF
jgi:hypothetical protein